MFLTYIPSTYPTHVLHLCLISSRIGFYFIFLPYHWVNFSQARSWVPTYALRYTCIAHIFPPHCYFQPICCLFASIFILFVCVCCWCSRAEGKNYYLAIREWGKNSYVEVVSDQYELRLYEVCIINRGCENII